MCRGRCGYGNCDVVCEMMLENPANFDPDEGYENPDIPIYNEMMRALNEPLAPRTG